ncbi:hypothetical protein [Streptomyces violascens]|uniref:hypothetical protein n=1 Tax=Streptomyces violascens TaxID=67381 RepID=UPI001679DF31|nr:hypothetical protein [Streptomyces violascens]GGT85649.1 hypothetical protein GCM10010289_01650 [Streptomyces violascens]
MPFLGVETLASHAEQERRQQAGLPEDLTRLAGRRDFLAHRRLSMPDGEFRVGIERGLLYTMAEPGGEVVGRFPLTIRHRVLDGLSKPQDVRPRPTMSAWRLLQFAGLTLVLLDDVADYLGRAWLCERFEALHR